MKFLLLDCFGVKVRIRARGDVQAEVLRELAQDFSHFKLETKTDGGAVLDLELRPSEPEQWPKRAGPPLFRTRMCRVHGWGPNRFCDYGKGMSVRARNLSDQRSFVLAGDDRHELHEVAYTLLLSAIGEELDLRGLHRIHAAGLQWGGRSALIVTGSGVGKSTLSAEFLGIGGARIFSDESPLLRAGEIRPFPLRLALRPEHAEKLKKGETGRPFPRRLFDEKILFSIPDERVAAPRTVDYVLVGRVAQGEPKILKVGRIRVFRTLLVEMVVGVGLAQMSEHMLRVDSLHRLIGIGFSRLGTALRLAFSSKGFLFEMARDSQANSRVLLEFLSKQGISAK